MISLTQLCFLFLSRFLRVYLHTLKIVDGATGNEVTPLKLDFVPGVDRQRPYSIEMVLQIPAKSFVEISIGFEYSLLKWLEYPPGIISLSNLVVRTNRRIYPLLQNV